MHAKRSIRRLASDWRLLADDDRGNVAIQFALVAIPLVAMVGAAIDLSRWQAARSVTKAAMDAAVLAGTKTLGQPDGSLATALQTAEAYYTRNIAQRTAVVSDSVSFRSNDAGTGITTDGNAYVATPFLHLLSVSQLPLLEESGAEGSEASVVKGGGGSNLEIALMLDVTGSMCADGQGPCTSSVKLDALKTAAKRLVDTVVWDDQSSYTSRVALVPFSTRVRVEPDGQGGAMMKKLTNLDPTWSGWFKMCVAGSGGGGSESGGNWSCSQYSKQYYSGWKIMPCVTERFYSWEWAFDYTDDAPGPAAWINAHDGSRMTLGFDSSDRSPSSDNYFKTRTGVSKSKAADHWNYAPWGGGGECADIGNANQILPMTSNRGLLHARIDGLEAFGSTGGALGTAFTWYMLSPKWSNVWVGSEPGSYDDLTEQNENGVPKLRKVAILMTDGVYNTYRGWKDQDQQYVSNAAVQLCTNMKNAGIEIFTVGFALDQIPPAERDVARATLESCGTDVEHFYDTLDVDQLVGAFEAIASKVTKSGIVLTK